MRLEVEHAAIAGDWHEIYHLLGSELSKVADPCERVLAGHGCLSENQCDQAFLFFSSISDSDLRDWNNWTGAMVKSHPNEAGAFYVRGDALARQDKWDEAIGAFDQSLKVEPKSALSH